MQIEAIKARLASKAVSKVTRTRLPAKEIIIRLKPRRAKA
jgi:hypothetical protein